MIERKRECRFKEAHQFSESRCTPGMAEDLSQKRHSCDPIAQTSNQSIGQGDLVVVACKEWPLRPKAARSV
ncbi:MAG: hypothetical protein DMD89_18030 [Candidatus Rokuibacteriota bacterium]|nr:MAG: hypothetical protein DMD89_18030 [Candidatus Rokubacteria bacterium]